MLCTVKQYIMDKVHKYINEHQQQMVDIFHKMSSQGQIEATKVFIFLQNAFNKEIRFILDGKNYFHHENQQNYKMEPIIEKYYKSTPDGSKGKFYLYRIKFYFDQVVEILNYWVSNESKLFIETVQEENHKMENQFLPRTNQISGIIKLYQQQIQKYEHYLKNYPQADDHEKYHFKITELKTKLQALQRNNKQHEQNEEQLNNKQQKQSQNENLISKQKQNENEQEIHEQVKNSSPTNSLKIKQHPINFKAIFQFYSKQTHLTGVKASFQRIEHESQTLNYQKLVHFLKQYQIFPKKVEGQRKLHNIYIRTCSKTRDLTYEQFLILMNKISQIVIEDPKCSNKFEIMKKKISDNSKKNTILNNPFHSSQKQNFRIDINELKYQFKLKPLVGKLEDQIEKQLQLRRKIKEEVKHDTEQLKKQQKKRYLKKLKSVDPFHPLLDQNKHLLKESNSISLQPVANFSNLQCYRDNSFDPRTQLGLDLDSDPFEQSFINSKKITKKLRYIEQIQVNKMRNLMNGIIERSNEKMKKMKISPKNKMYKR